MTARLPDVALAESSAILCALDEVGMSGIALPLSLDEPGTPSPVQARADLRVDLPIPSVKGIHMSRLYRLLDTFSGEQVVTPASLHQLLIQSQGMRLTAGASLAGFRLDAATSRSRYA